MQSIDKKTRILLVVFLLSLSIGFTETENFAFTAFIGWILVSAIVWPLLFFFKRDNWLAPITIVFMLVGLFFKSMAWPAASILTSVSVALFAFAYAPKVYLFEQKTAPLYLRLLGFISLPLISLAWIFKLQNWSGSPKLFLLGVITWVPFMIVLFFFQGHKKLKLSTTDIVMHVAFFSLMADVLINQNVKIQTAPTFVQNARYWEAQSETSSAEFRLAKITSDNLDRRLQPIEDALIFIANERTDFTDYLKAKADSGDLEFSSFLEKSWKASPDFWEAVTEKYLMSPNDSEIVWNRMAFAERLVDFREDAAFPKDIDSVLFGSSQITPTRIELNAKIDWNPKSWYMIHFLFAGPYEVFAYLDLLEMELHKAAEYIILMGRAPEEAPRILKSMKGASAKYYSDMELHRNSPRKMWNAYHLVLISLLLIFLLYMFYAPSIKSERIFSGFTFMFFALVFEFVLFLSMPFWESKFGGNIIPLFAVNALMALLLVPVHNFFESLLRQRVRGEEL